MTDVEAFKNELKNLRYYQKKVEILSNEISLMEYEMANVKGVDYSKQGGNNYNPIAVEEKRLAMIEKYEKLLKKKKNVKMRINDIYEVLNRMETDDRLLVIEVVANKVKYREVCDRLGISTSVLHSRINEIIENAL